jgi:putative transcriptional regulator
MRAMKRWLLAAAVLFTGSAAAQPNGLLLVAKPGLADPNFSRSVVLVTQSDDGSSVGVILNRPAGKNSLGGPVMREVQIALFAADEPPRAAAFRVLPNVYLSMHPQIVVPLARANGTNPRVRIFSGFAGWAPRQLAAEIDSGSWYVLRASEELLFRKDTTGMWEELVEKARGVRARTPRADILAA